MLQDVALISVLHLNHFGGDVSLGPLSSLIVNSTQRFKFLRQVGAPL
jgi:hypothetical protein